MILVALVFRWLAGGWLLCCIIKCYVMNIQFRGTPSKGAGVKEVVVTDVTIASAVVVLLCNGFNFLLSGA